MAVFSSQCRSVSSTSHFSACTQIHNSPILHLSFHLKIPHLLTNLGKSISNTNFNVCSLEYSIDDALHILCCRLWEENRWSKSYYAYMVASKCSPACSSLCLVAKLKTMPKIRDNYGSGWVGPDLTRTKKNWKIVPKCSYTGADILELYTVYVVILY